MLGQGRRRSCAVESRGGIADLPRLQSLQMPPALRSPALDQLTASAEVDRRNAWPRGWRQDDQLGTIREQLYLDLQPAHQQQAHRVKEHPQRTVWWLGQVRCDSRGEEVDALGAQLE